MKYLDYFHNTRKKGTTKQIDGLADEIHIQMSEEYEMPPFHLWESGFEQGDASDEETKEFFENSDFDSFKDLNNEFIDRFEKDEEWRPYCTVCYFHRSVVRLPKLEDDISGPSDHRLSTYATEVTKEKAAEIIENNYNEDKKWYVFDVNDEKINVF